jgi:hypothetical protein
MLEDSLNEVLNDLALSGFSYIPAFAPQGDEGHHLLKLIHRLGIPFVPPGKEQNFPIITTQPAHDAPVAEPFNRSERIGWHNDFSTLRCRPALSLSWIARADPAVFVDGKGCWMVAGSKPILEHLRQKPEGDKLTRFLSETPLPFAYEASDEVCWAKVIDDNPHRAREKGIRFYRRSILEGCKKEYGTVPQIVVEAIDALESAADVCGNMLPSVSGALLVCDNWMCLHDRTVQSTESSMSSRIAYLAFVGQRKILTNQEEHKS